MLPYLIYGRKFTVVCVAFENLAQDHHRLNGLKKPVSLFYTFIKSKEVSPSDASLKDCVHHA